MGKRTEIALRAPSTGTAERNYWSKIKIMQEEGTLPVHSDQDALNLAYGGATRLLVISDAAVDRSWPLFLGLT